MQPGAVPDDAPFALVANTANRLTLSAVTTAAVAAGLSPGMGLADARAVCPALVSCPAEPARDAAALGKLARWCARYGPAFNTDGADGLWVDSTGVAHLFGGEAGLLGDLCRRFARFGLTAWPGLGSLMLQALRTRDIYLVAGCAGAGALFLACGTLVSDLALAAIDPRTSDARAEAA